MATRIDLNLPPRLLESARATQAANQRQLLNREQQTRDAREVRRQLRQAEAQGRTVRGREQERRGNGVPQFPLSAGDRLPRRGLPRRTGYTLAQAFYSLVSTGQSGPSEVTDKYELWSGNQKQKETLTLTFGNLGSGAGVSTLNVVLPAGGDTLIYANGRTYAYESQVSTDCFVISRSGARKITTPPVVQDLADRRIAGLTFQGNSIQEVAEDNYESNPPTSSAYGVLYTGDPASMEAMLQIPESNPPDYLTLRTQYLSKTMQGVTHRTADREGPGRRAPWVPRTVRLETESALAASPRLASVSLIAWDWGKPALCRQLLLQLGFSPADLTP